MHHKTRNALGLRGKLILAMVAIGAIPIVLGLSATYFKGAAQLRKIIGDSFEALAMNSASKIDGEIQRLIDADKILARQAIREQAVTGALSGALKGGKLDWPAPGEIKARSRFILRSWVSGHGDAAADHAVPGGSDLSRAELFHPGNQKDRYVLDITTPIRAKADGNAIGWLHRRYDANRMLDSLVYPIRFGVTGHVMLIDNRGTVMSCPFLPTGTSIADTGLTSLVARANAGWIRTENDGHGGKKDSLIGHAPLIGLNGYLQRKGRSLFAFVWQDSEEIFAPIRSLQHGVILAGFTALLLLGLLGFYASTRVVKPIRRLSEEAGFIAQGDLSRSIDIRSGDEIEELASQFNHMTSRLRQLVEHLEDKVEERTRDLVATQVEKDQVVKQLIQTEKIAAIGTMTSGIGHEINNPLYAILGRAEAIADGAALDQCREYSREIVKYCKHIASIIKDLAGFVRPNDGDTLESVDVNEKITEAVAMVNMSLLDDHVKIEEKCHDVPEVQGRPQEIQQAVFNIIRNGVQALRGNGVIDIASFVDGDRVHVTIRDNGPGISREHLEKIFDPFFTTKGPDEGEGLGLYVVQQTVKKSGGSIKVESELGKGTVFHLTFPIMGNISKEAINEA